MHLGIERGRRGLRSKILNVATSTAMKVRSGVVTASRLAHIERKAIFSAECPKEQAHKLSIKVGMLARQRGTNMNLQSKFVRCHEIGLTAPLERTARPVAVVAFPSCSCCSVLTVNIR